MGPASSGTEKKTLLRNLWLSIKAHKLRFEEKSIESLREKGN